MALTLQDLYNLLPQKAAQHIRDIGTYVNTLSKRQDGLEASTLTKAEANALYSPKVIQQHLQANGTAPLNLTNLPGSSATPASGAVTHTSGALTANDPVFGNGGGDAKVGTRSGNTTEVATVNGALTPGHFLTTDASGNIIDGGTTPSSFSTQNVVTGSRSTGTVFQNTAAKTMYVNVALRMNTGAASVTADTDASNPPTTTVASGDNTSSASTWVISLNFMVLPGNFYEVNIVGGTLTLIASWVEWI